jgi:hypothetical protein
MLVSLPRGSSGNPRGRTEGLSCSRQVVLGSRARILIENETSDAGDREGGGDHEDAVSNTSCPNAPTHSTVSGLGRGSRSTFPCSVPASALVSLGSWLKGRTKNVPEKIPRRGDGAHRARH